MATPSNLYRLAPPWSKLPITDQHRNTGESPPGTLPGGLTFHGTGDLALREVRAQTSDYSTGNLSLTLVFDKVPGLPGSELHKTFSNVPRRARDLEQVFSGTSSSYRYDSPRNILPNETAVYVLPTDGESLGLIVSGPAVGNAIFQVTAATSGQSSQCDLVIRLSSGFGATWRDLPRNPQALIDRLLKSLESTQRQVLRHVHILSSDQESSLQNTTVAQQDLRALCPFLRVEARDPEAILPAAFSFQVPQGPVRSPGSAVDRSVPAVFAKAAASGLQATVRHKLTEDYFMSQDILLDLTSPTPLAAIQNPSGETEALVIGSDRRLSHVRRDSTTEAGWQQTTLAEGNTVTEIVAGLDFSNRAHAFYADQTSLYQICLQSDGSWTTPYSLPLCRSLGTTTVPQTQQLLVYGVTSKGDLQIVHNGEEEWEATTVDFSGKLLQTRPLLFATDDQNSTLAVIRDGRLEVYQIFRGAVSSGPFVIETPAAVDKVLMARQGQGSPLLVFTDEQGQLYSSVGFTDQICEIPNGSVETGGGFVDEHGMLHFYGVDKKGTLWVLHQIGWNGDLPTWAPYFPLETDFLRVHVSNYALGAPHLFGVSDDGSLRALSFDPAQKIWTRQTPRTASIEPTPVTTYRSQINLTDGGGVPQFGREVVVSSSAPVALRAAGKTYHLAPGRPASLSTNAMGFLSMATTARGLHTPVLTLSSEGLDPLEIHPAKEIHAYLSGQGSLDDLPPLTGTGLQQARVNGRRLAPALRDRPKLAAAVAKGLENSLRSWSPDPALQNQGTEGGWVLDLSDPQQPAFNHISATDLAEHRSSLASSPTLGDFGGSLTHFLADVWHAIESGAMKVVKWVVDTAKKAVSFTVKLGEGIAHLVDLAIRGIEDAVSIVQSILVEVGAAISDVVDWLKSIFRWDDIWAAKTAIEGWLSQMAPFLGNVIENKIEKPADHFFANLEGEVRQAFGVLEKNYGDLTLKQLIASLQQAGKNTGFQATGSQAAGFQAAAADPTEFIADYQADPQANWLMDKLLSDLGTLDFAPPEGLEKPWGDLSRAVTDSAGDFKKAFEDLEAFLKKNFSSPESLGNVPIRDLFDALEQTVLGVLRLIDGLVDAFLDLVALAVEGMGDLLFAPLDLPLLTPLIHWIQQLVDPGSKPIEISLASCLSMVLAIPFTVLYKLMVGSKPRFPNQNLFLASSDDASGYEELFLILTLVTMPFYTAASLALDSSVDGKGIPSPYQALGAIVLPAFLQTFTWPFGVPYMGGVPDGEELTFWTWMSAWLAPIVDATVLFVTALFSRVQPEISETTAHFLDPVGKLLDTLAGCLNWMVAIVLYTSGAPTHLQAWTNILLAIPVFTQALRLEDFVRDSKGTTLDIQLGIDVVFNGIVMILLYIQIIQSMSKDESFSVPGSRTLFRNLEEPTARTGDQKGTGYSARAPSNLGLAQATNGPTEKEILGNLTNRTVTNGWDVVVALDAPRINALLQAQYVYKVGKDENLPPMNGMVPIIEQTYVRLSGLILGPPRVRFDAAGLSANEANLEIPLIAGTVETLQKAGDGYSLLEIQRIRPENGYLVQGTVPLTALQGEVKDKHDVVIDIVNGRSFTADLHFAPGAANKLGQHILEFLSQHATGFQYELGTLTYNTEGALTPCFFDFSTDTGRLLLFVATAFNPKGGPKAEIFANEIVPDGSSATLLVSSEVVFKEIILPAVAKQLGPHGARVESFQKDALSAYRLSTSGGSLNIGEVRKDYSLTQFYSSDGTYGPPTSVSLALGGIEVAPQTDAVQLSWHHKWQQGWTRIQSTNWGPIQDSGTAEMTVDVTSTNEGQIDPVTQVVQFKGTGEVKIKHPTANSFWQKIFTDKGTAGYITGIIGDRINSKISKLFDFSLPEINTFAVSNLLFPRQHILDFKSVHMPGDLVIFGDVRALSLTLSPSESSLGSGDTCQFTASLDSTQTQGLRWTSSPRGLGTISQTGLYTAPATLTGPALVTVTAFRPADPKKNTPELSASALVHLVPSEVQVTPSFRVAAVGDSPYSFKAMVPDGGDEVDWSLTPVQGSLNEDGVYSPPAQVDHPQVVTIRATQRSDASISGSALVALLPYRPAIAITPVVASLGPSKVQVFSSLSGASWSIFPEVGHIDSDGTYTAPANPGDLRRVLVVAAIQKVVYGVAVIELVDHL